MFFFRARETILDSKADLYYERNPLTFIHET